MPAGKKGFQKGKSGNPRGRPKGAKNSVTIFKEAMVQGAEDVMIKQIKKIVQVVCEKAAEGDMTAAKMVLDRLLPTTKAIDPSALGKSGGVTIKIEGLENARTAVVEDGEFIEVDNETSKKDGE